MSEVEDGTSLLRHRLTSPFMRSITAKRWSRTPASSARFGFVAMQRGLCAFHADPKRAAQLGRIGGRKNRRYAPCPEASAVHPPQTAKEVKNLLAEAMVGIHSGRLEPKIGSTMPSHPEVGVDRRGLHARCSQDQTFKCKWRRATGCHYLVVEPCVLQNCEQSDCVHHSRFRILEQGWSSRGHRTRFEH
jgi:hypothetical protein